MKTLVFKTLLIALPLIVIITITNIIIDTSNIFNLTFSKSVAAYICNGNNVTNIADYDERIAQKEIIKCINPIPSNVVFGSSRGMLINNSFFPDEGLLNCSVSGASLHDFIAIFQILLEEEKLPKRIIFSIDPWLFQESSIEGRWESIGEYYYNFKSESKILPVNLFKLKALLSISYFQTCLKSVFFSVIKNSPITTNELYNESITKLSDGSITYGRLYRESSTQEINVKISSYIQGKIKNNASEELLSKKRIDEFEKLINSIKAKEIEVIFVLLPYHPKVYDEVKREIPKELEVENLVNEMASNYSIPIYGSFSPGKLNYDGSYFYDGNHCNEKGVKGVIQKINLKGKY